MHMLLERAASLFQSEGWLVKVSPCIIGDSGAIHSPDLQLRRDGERDRVVFVLEALDGPAPLESRAHMAKDMACEPVFVVGDPSPEVAHWAARHRKRLLTLGDLDAAPEGPPAGEPAPIPEESAAEVLTPPTPAPRVPERPLAAYAPPPPAPGEPDDTDAELLPTTPRPDAPKPRRARAPEPEGDVPEDGGVELLGARAVAPAPPPAPAPGRAPAAAVERPADTGAEMLPSMPTGASSGDQLAKHDPAIWDPRARLAQVKQAAKALSFDTTAVPEGPASAWLRTLRRA